MKDVDFLKKLNDYRRKDIVISHSILDLVNGSIQSAMFLSFMVDQALANNGEPFTLKVGQNSSDKDITLCSYLSVDRRKIYKMLELLGSEVTEYGTSESVIEYKKNAGNVFLFNINPDGFRKLEIQKNILNQKAQTGLRFLNQKAQTGLEKLSPNRLSDSNACQENTPCSPPSYISPPDKFSSLHSENYKKFNPLTPLDKKVQGSLHLVNGGTPRTKVQILMDSVIPEVKEHPSWKELEPIFHDWMEHLFSQKRNRSSMTVSWIKGITRNLLSMLKKHDPFQLQQQIAYSMSKSFLMLYEPKKDPRYDAKGGTPGAMREVINLFRDVSAENPFPFVDWGEIESIDTSFMSIIEAANIDRRDLKEDDLPLFRSWFWVMMSYAEIIDKYHYEFHSEKNMFRWEPSEYGCWKARGEKSRRYGRPIVSVITRWIDENIKPLDNIYLKMFKKGSIFTNSLLEDLSLPGCAFEYSKVDRDALFDMQIAKVISAEYRAEFDAFFVNPSEKRFGFEKDDNGKWKRIDIEVDRSHPDVPYFKSSSNWKEKES